jgi:N-formylglutamate amidohydrolase
VAAPAAIVHMMSRQPQVQRVRRMTRDDHPIELLPAAEPLRPVVLSSPHSGSIYPPSLLDAARLGLAELRRLEDAFVHRLVAGAPARGAPVVQARFARAFVDPNREPLEIDPLLVDGPLPAAATLSAKAQAGLGTVPSRIGGRPIYRARLAPAEFDRRLEQAYWPYHGALARLVEQALARFGVALLLDCHSMPGVAQPGLRERPVDIALGDRFGRGCAPPVIEAAEALLRDAGLRVARNRPYAGGFITAHYGRPETGVHALQIEIRRALYMDERTLVPHQGLDALAGIMDRLVARLGDLVEERLMPARERVRGGLSSTG